MKRARRARVATIVGAASMVVGVSACANDGNAGDANVVNIVNDVDEVDGAAQTTAADDATGRFDIEIANFQFSPAEAVVPAGTKVVWLNADTDIHSIISTGELFASSDTFANGESYAVTLTEPGTYPYTCGVHPFMMGTITVE
jgi:plastocyanin